jgi:Phytanoyl-CoA dioxygenase (PhyH)
MEHVTLDDLVEEWEPELVPATESDPQTPLQQQWADHGFVILDDLIPDEVLEAYRQEWWDTHGSGWGDPLPPNFSDDPRDWRSPGGWPYATPYMNNPALANVVCNRALADVLEELTGEPMGVHLNLTGWVSTRRNWHRDQYLNEPYVGGFYAAVWIALDDIVEDAGPFEYVPGSHKGAPISGQKIRHRLGEDGDGPDWPTHSERILTPLFEEEVQSKGLNKQRFIAKRGQVLIWHGRLLHRGSLPNDPGIERRALIAHYSGILHRPDMPKAIRSIGAGGWYFPIEGHQPVSDKYRYDS